MARAGGEFIVKADITGDLPTDLAPTHRSAMKDV
jgi:hypothetical protein